MIGDDGKPEQAIPYLEHASELLERTGLNGLGLRHALALMVIRLGTESRSMAETITDCSAMRGMAKVALKLNQPDAATQIMNAAYILRDRSNV